MCVWICICSVEASNAELKQMGDTAVKNRKGGKEGAVNVKVS